MAILNSGVFGIGSLELNLCYVAGRNTLVASFKNKHSSAAFPAIYPREMKTHFTQKFVPIANWYK